MTNLFIDRIFSFGKRQIPFIELWMIWASSSLGDGNFSKFKHLFTDKFFRCKKWVYSYKNWIKLLVRNTPCKLISVSFRNFRFFNEMKLTAKTLRNPIKKRGFCIVALNLRCISKCFIFILFFPAYIKTAFSINKSSKISKIFECGRYCISNTMQFFFNRIVYKPLFVFQKFHFFYKRFFSFFSSRFFKLFENRIFFFFFNKIFGNFVQHLKASFRKSKMIGTMFAITRWFNNSDSSFYMITKPIYGFFFCGNNSKMTTPFLVSYLKTSISIYITSRIGKICTFHAKYDELLQHLSQQVIELSNNAYKFVSGIEGENKFGKMCAEAKSDLIEVEFFAA